MRHPEEDRPAIKVKQKIVELDAILLKGASDPEIQSRLIGSTLYLSFCLLSYLKVRKKTPTRCLDSKRHFLYWVGHWHSKLSGTPQANFSTDKTNLFIVLR